MITKEKTSKNEKERRKLYRNDLWVSFRSEVIELDGNSCVRCGRSQGDGAILQVHHISYTEGKLPWEYPLNQCEALCKRCHAEEHGKIRPNHGWHYVYDEDLGGLYGVCERCNTEIRYAFLVDHPHWEPMTVGTYCCDEVTGTEYASKRRKHDERVKRFLHSKRWEKSGDSVVITQKQMKILILPDDFGYKIKIKDVEGKSSYSTIDDAKRRVFEFIDSGDADNFFKKMGGIR